MTSIVNSTQLLALAGQVMDVEARTILMAKERLGPDFLAAVDLLYSCPAGGRVVVTGMGKSGHIGRKISATLASTGTPSLFVHPAEAAHGDLGMVTQHDVVLAISQSGNSDELAIILPYLKRNRIPVVAMTAKFNSTLAQHADVVIDTSVQQEACPLGLAPTASTTVALSLGDAIAMCLAQARGFTAEMFAETHPHGALGRRLLLTVADVMVTGADNPIAHVSASIREALVTMTQAGLGYVNVMNDDRRLVGVFTDGDLRRVIDSDVNIKIATLGAVINPTFVTIKSSKLAVEAVEMMETYKISSMPAVDDSGCLVGALNMRILLQAGVV